ncbi:histidine kinase [Leptolyngbya sp. FACHB-16]|uniref:histidine kinase n=1 Tax=unclassified Leptolyngbya TaxID=2650499 RepID=UPI0016838DB7|nr:histidine kinase [Leptolyngbya sp. FACHB-16]MBD2157530.1 histidine kinase [Leptolyngbya sp. FACHB-16]
MPAIPFHIIVEGNPALIYASRNGSPEKVLRILNPFLEKFWQERALATESSDTPEFLVAQLVVRFGFEFSEDDYSNLKVGISFDPRAQYLYLIHQNQTVQIYKTTETYQKDSSIGLAGCEAIESHAIS